MNSFDLDQPIIELASPTERNYWTIRHAVEGVQIFGGIGSGKTSGSGRMLALKYLKAGFGGLVLTVKPDEKQSWVEYCQKTGRSNDLIILEPGGRHSFNFLSYESAQSGGASSLTENLVDVLKTVIRAGEQQDKGKGDDPFWETALDMLMFNVIDLCQIAYGKVTVKDLYNVAQTIPKNIEDLKLSSEENAKYFHKAFEAAKERVNQQVEEWYLTLSHEDQERMQDELAMETELLEAIPSARLFRFIDQFFVENFITLTDKTRSIIDFIFSGFLFRLLREPVYSMFCRHELSTVTPEDSLRGKIILINLPVKIYHKVGRDCQILFKYLWQRAMEKRDIGRNDRPVFLWADEAQNFIHEKDADFQATARSSRVSTVYISQNLPNYLASMGGQHGEYKVKSFLGTLATKIFHANADIETNKYASELIGDAFFEDHGDSVTYAKNFSHSHSTSFKLERVVRPEEFVRLRTGGPNNKFFVEGYLHRQGDVIFKGQNHIKMLFQQNYQP
ncbi:type IV secretory system conjugative DNA transfer family protein [Dyadobacter sp. CY347]|uniref:type IV secretory system conjugative DNA transfer family protein n=1 Tax=Dyadobacter sp. CY347 TaxID=2909336 RepID=UPI001F1E747C|nr:type IV secretory system conjugative DNA transfer family protein [Dyadobacter sp. CY347]MCF2491121.1 TraG/TraD/VirD4 family protein [Dyadobacter sp. CY347]